MRAAPAADVEVVYDDEDLQVIWQDGASDVVLITFNDLFGSANGIDFFAAAPARKSGFAALGFVAKRSHWYRTEAMARAVAQVRGRLDAYALRVAYGGSMGGYAAIKHSRALGADRVVALCPQWSLDPQECGGVDPGWGGYFEPQMRGMGVRAADVAGDVYVFADPGDPLDDFHARRIAAAWPGAVLVDVRMVGHGVTPVLAGSDNLRALVEAVVARDAAALRQLVRRSRRGSFLRVETLLARGYARHPGLCAPILFAVASAFPPLLKDRPDQLLDCLAYAARSGRGAEGLALLERCEPLADPQMQQRARILAARLG